MRNLHHSNHVVSWALSDTDTDTHTHWSVASVDDVRIWSCLGFLDYHQTSVHITIYLFIHYKLIFQCGNYVIQPTVLGDAWWFYLSMYGHENRARTRSRPGSRIRKGYDCCIAVHFNGPIEMMVVVMSAERLRNIRGEYHCDQWDAMDRGIYICVLVGILLCWCTQHNIT